MKQWYKMWETNRVKNENKIQESNGENIRNFMNNKWAYLWIVGEYFGENLIEADAIIIT